MHCSVVIPCHNGEDLTRACVDSLMQQDDPPTEILLVDNASTDATARLDGRHGTVRVLRQPHNLGFAGGVNRGIRAARAPWILVCNNDTQAAPNLLRELHHALESDPRIAAAAPVSNHVKGPALLPIGGRGRDAVDRAQIAAALQHEAVPIQDVDTLAGLCLLLRRTTFAAVGLFDERFGHGNFEDDDFCLRLRLLGHRLVIARRAFLHHEGHATFRALGLDLATEIERRRHQFVAKWRHDPAGRATIAAQRGDVLGAAAGADAAQHLWPNWPDADWHQARACVARGDHAAAIPHLRSLLRSCPRHSDAAVELACALLSCGQRATAEAHLAATVHQCHLPTAHQVRLLSALGENAYHSGRPADAARDFEAAAALSAPSGALHNWLGVCRLAADDLTAAARAFEAAIALDFALAHGNLGIVRHRQGQSEDARACFRKALELSPGDPIALANLQALQQIEPVASV